MLTAITGINWGDEGKGRMVDLISQEYDIVARYQGCLLYTSRPPVSWSAVTRIRVSSGCWA